MAIQQLAPTQLQQHQSQRNKAKTGLLASRAQNQYQRQLGDIDFANKNRQFATQWGRRREELPSGYLERGVFNSGIYHDALQKYTQDRLQGYQDMNIGHMLDQQGLTFQDRGAEDAYFQAMADSYGGEFSNRAQVAATLREIL